MRGLPECIVVFPTKIYCQWCLRTSGSRAKASCAFWDPDKAWNLEFRCQTLTRASCPRCGILKHLVQVLSTCTTAVDCKCVSACARVHVPILNTDGSLSGSVFMADWASAQHTHTHTPWIYVPLRQRLWCLNNAWRQCDSLTCTLLGCCTFSFVSIF